MLLPPAPPEVPSGWVTGPPDFVGVGVQRAGTTRWYRLITAHQDVVGEERKELHYFDRYWMNPDSDTRTYPAYFPRPPGAICGEWTPRYMFDHWTPALLAAAAPEARLIVSLRDPVERYISGLGWLRRAETGSGQWLNRLAPADTAYRGLYGAQLRRLLRHFKRERLLVLQYERCVAAPHAELERTFQFLGIDPARGPTSMDGIRNTGDRPALPDHERRELVSFYERDVRELVAECAEIDLALWPNFRHLA